MSLLKARAITFCRFFIADLTDRDTLKLYKNPPSHWDQALYCLTSHITEKHITGCVQCLIKGQFISVTLQATHSVVYGLDGDFAIHPVLDLGLDV